MIGSLPDDDKPSFFGLPANIERSAQRMNSTQVRPCSRGGGGGGGGGGLETGALERVEWDWERPQFPTPLCSAQWMNSTLVRLVRDFPDPILLSLSHTMANALGSSHLIHQHVVCSLLPCVVGNTAVP